MRAPVYHGPGQKAWEEIPDPVLVDDTDAIVRVEATTMFARAGDSRALKVVLSRPSH